MKDAGAEHERMHSPVTRQKLEFWFKCDETSFFWWAVDNHGLSTKAVPGKKLDKAQISVLVVTNATGTRKIVLLSIGNAKQPQCFKQKPGKHWVSGTSTTRKCG